MATGVHSYDCDCVVFPCRACGRLVPLDDVQVPANREGKVICLRCITQAGAEQGAA